MRWVMTSKPLCASTTSTMAMAPIRKKTICAVPISESPSSLADLVVIAGGHRVDGPQHAGADQRRSRLVDLEGMFQRDRGVGDDKYGDNDNQCSQHGRVDAGVSKISGAAGREGGHGTRRESDRKVTRESSGG
jgi:hypothetical protein